MNIRSLTTVAALLLAPTAFAQDPQPTALAPPALGAEAPTETPSGEVTPPVVELPAEVSPPSAMPPATAKPSQPGILLPDACNGNPLCFTKKGYSIWPRVRIRSGYEFIMPDQDVPFVGQNDGFLLQQARVGLEGKYKHYLDYRLIIDGVSLLPGGGANEPTRPVVSALRDAYLSFHVVKPLDITFGQLYMPASRETLTRRNEFVFTNRSVAISGIGRGQGFVVSGLGASRELGLTLGKTDLELGPLLLDYVLGVSNGNGTNVFGNDNKLPEISARVALGFKRFVDVGFFGRYNPRTVGELPSLFDETDLIAGADIEFNISGIQLMGQGVYRQTSFDTVFPDGGEGGSDTGLGLTAQLTLNEPFGLNTLGLHPGVRVSYYDPQSAFDDDALTELTVGLRYDFPKDIPVAAMFDYTLLRESEGARSIDNDRATLILQFDL